MLILERERFFECYKLFHYSSVNEEIDSHDSRLGTARLGRLWLRMVKVVSTVAHASFGLAALRLKSAFLSSRMARAAGGCRCCGTRL